MIALREGVAGRCSLKKSSFNFLSKILRKTPPMKVLFSTVKDLVLNHQLTCYSVFMSLFVVISYFFIIVMRYWFYIFFIISQYTLIHFMPLVSFYTPLKHQKTYGFLMFQGVQKETSGMNQVNIAKNLRHQQAIFFCKTVIFMILSLPLSLM